MKLITLRKKNGVTIQFECNLSEAEARQIILAAHAAHQNVGDFALKLSQQRQALTELQSGWLKYLAMEISGQLRQQQQQLRQGPWAWLLKLPHYKGNGIEVTSPPTLKEPPIHGQQSRWVRVLYRREWRYVGHIDQDGGFQFSKEIVSHATSAGRSAMVLLFPGEEQRLKEEAQRLQFITSQKLETLKQHG